MDFELLDINKKYSGAEAPEVLTRKVRGKTFKYVPFNIKKSKDGIYEWYYVFLGPGAYNYEGLVDAIIGKKYSLRNMMAIVNNYLYDSTNAEYKKEFDAMQKWRILAKKSAKQHFNL